MISLQAIVQNVGPGVSHELVPKSPNPSIHDQTFKIHVCQSELSLEVSNHSESSKTSNVDSDKDKGDTHNGHSRRIIAASGFDTYKAILQNQ